MKKLLMFSSLFLSVSFYTDNVTAAAIDNIKNMSLVFQAQTHEEKIKQFLCMVKNAIKCESTFSVLKCGIEHVVIDGLYLEMGVFQGNTINFIASVLPSVTIHGFDSFEGLPEDWIREDTTYFAKGCFAISRLPYVAFNVKLYKGWFEDSLPIFKKDTLKDKSIAFLHIDCDLYSSTKTVFDLLGDYIVDGTIIAFDELYGYPGFENHEFKALYEFLERKGLDAQFLAYNVKHEQVVIKITRP